jgi:hypothetical protein
VSPLFGQKTASEVPAVEASANGGPPALAERGGVLEGVSSLAGARPELIVAAAFAGGIAIAILARRLAR